jgi:hypothetical protein
VDQGRSRQPFGGATELLAREIDTGQPPALGEDLARANPRADAELEQFRPLGQQLQQFGKVTTSGLVGDPCLPLGEAVGDRVVATLDDPLRVVRQAAASAIARRAAWNCSSVSRMYEWRPRLLGMTPAASTGGASRRSASTSRGSIANRQAQRLDDGSFSGCETTSTTPNTTRQTAA